MNSARKIPSTTLVCFDTDNHVLAKLALERTARLCEFDRVIYFSDVDWAVRESIFIKVDKIKSGDEYSDFMLKGLLPYIETNHVMVVQYDGFIVNPDLWMDDFLSYDYIGAPWPAFRDYSVGNGGFSLRSRRLLEALQDKVIERHDGEDATICRYFRSYLEVKYGIKFASPEIALQFSYESAFQPVGGSFGFHGMLNVGNYFRGKDAEFFLNNLSSTTYSGSAVWLLFIRYVRDGFNAEARLAFDKIRSVQTRQMMDDHVNKLGINAQVFASLIKPYE
jgi:hypothetical protein